MYMTWHLFLSSFYYKLVHSHGFVALNSLVVECVLLSFQIESSLIDWSLSL